MTDTAEINYDQIIHETEQAMLIDVGEDDGVWIPKSVIQDRDEDAKALFVEEWWAFENGMI